MFIYQCADSASLEECFGFKTFDWGIITAYVPRVWQTDAEKYNRYRKLDEWFSLTLLIKIQLLICFVAKTEDLNELFSSKGFFLSVEQYFMWNTCRISNLSLQIFLPLEKTSVHEISSVTKGHSFILSWKSSFVEVLSLGLWPTTCLHSAAGVTDNVSINPFRRQFNHSISANHDDYL